MDSIINIVKPQKHGIEIYNASALIICIHDNICNFKEKRATDYNGNDDLRMRIVAVHRGTFHL